MEKSIATEKVIAVDEKQKRIVMTEESLLDISPDEMDQFLFRRSFDNTKRSSLILVDIEQSRSDEKGDISRRGRENRYRKDDDRSVSFSDDYCDTEGDLWHRFEGSRKSLHREGRGTGSEPVRSSSRSVGHEPTAGFPRTTGGEPVGLFNRRIDEAGPEPAWGKSHADGQASSRGDTRIYDCSTPRQPHSSRHLDSPSRREYSRDPRQENSADHSDGDNQKLHEQVPFTRPERSRNQPERSYNRPEYSYNRPEHSSEQTAGVRVDDVGTQERCYTSYLLRQNDSIDEKSGGTRRCIPSATYGAKLGTYNGMTCLETFLAKFDNCSHYFGWDTEDQLFQLKAALDGAAGQILWDLDRAATVEQIQRLLRCRFGNDNQAERFRAELRIRRLKRGESLQTLYLDICRLMTLAYPGPTSSLSEIVGRDAFLEALDDQQLRVRILEREPRTLDEALNAAVRLEAFDQKAPEEVLSKDDGSRGKTRFAKTVTQDKKGKTPSANPDKAEPGVWAEVLRRLDELSTEVKVLREERQPPKAVMQEAPRAVAVGLMKPVQRGSRAGNASDTEFSRAPRPPNRYQQGSRQRRDGNCRSCGEMGHWARECPHQESNMG